MSAASDLHQQALETREPKALPLRFFADDRGWSLMNLFVGVLHGGQCNYSILYSGVYKAWHRHATQTDFWVVTQGNAKIGVYDQENQKQWTFFLGEKSPQLLIIPPGLWHGLTPTGNAPCGLLYYVDQEYDLKAPREERRPHDFFPAFRWDVEHK